ncbi:F-box domain-containing protein [Mycena kentingensis (nom. inval.)]|nr:F-box domain-containing protein [Mycena kentingensis (nom. inval.)]
MNPVLYLKTLVSTLFALFLAFFKPSRHATPDIDTGQGPILPVSIVEPLPIPTTPSVEASVPKTSPAPPRTPPRRAKPTEDKENAAAPPMVPSESAFSLTYTKPRPAPRPPLKSPGRARQRQHWGRPVIVHTVHPRSLMPTPLNTVTNVPGFMVHKALKEVETIREKIEYEKKQKARRPKKVTVQEQEQPVPSRVFKPAVNVPSRRHSFNETRVQLPTLSTSTSAPDVLGKLSCVVKQDSDQLWTALMREAESTACAIDAEREEHNSLSLISCISASRSMSALAGASSRSISDLLNAFDAVMASPSWQQVLVRSQDISTRRRAVEALV